MKIFPVIVYTDDGRLVPLLDARLLGVDDYQCATSIGRCPSGVKWIASSPIRRHRRPFVYIPQKLNVEMSNTRSINHLIPMMHSTVAAPGRTNRR